MSLALVGIIGGEDEEGSGKEVRLARMATLRSNFEHYYNMSAGLISFWSMRTLVRCIIYLRKLPEVCVFTQRDVPFGMKYFSECAYL